MLDYILGLLTLPALGVGYFVIWFFTQLTREMRRNFRYYRSMCWDKQNIYYTFTVSPMSYPIWFILWLSFKRIWI